MAKVYTPVIRLRGLETIVEKPEGDSNESEHFPSEDGPEEQRLKLGSHEDVPVELELPEEELKLTDLPNTTPEHLAEEPKAPVAVRKLRDTFSNAPHPGMTNRTRVADKGARESTVGIRKATRARTRTRLLRASTARGYYIGPARCGKCINRPGPPQVTGTGREHYPTSGIHDSAWILELFGGGNHHPSRGSSVSQIVVMAGGTKHETDR